MRTEGGPGHLEEEAGGARGEDRACQNGHKGKRKGNVHTHTRDGHSRTNVLHSQFPPAALPRGLPPAPSDPAFSVAATFGGRMATKPFLQRVLTTRDGAKVRWGCWGKGSNFVKRARCKCTRLSCCLFRHEDFPPPEEGRRRALLQPTALLDSLTRQNRYFFSPDSFTHRTGAWPGRCSFSSSSAAVPGRSFIDLLPQRARIRVIIIIECAPPRLPPAAAG